MREHVLSTDFEPAKNAADGAIICAADHAVTIDVHAAHDFRPGVVERLQQNARAGLEDLELSLRSKLNYLLGTHGHFSMEPITPNTDSNDYTSC